MGILDWYAVSVAVLTTVLLCAHGLALALLWWPVAFVLALTYLAVILREYRGKVRPSDDTQGYS